MAAPHAHLPSRNPFGRIFHALFHPLVMMTVGGVLLLVFAVWIVLVAAPVFTVEMKYRYRLAMQNVFGTTDLRRVFFPNLSVDLRGYQSSNRENGITIPKIFVDEPVVYNVDPNNVAAYTAALKQGIAHASGTSFPDSGGLGYYFAHSSAPEFRNQFNAVFYLLGKLEVGDEVFLWHEGKRYEYKVAWTLETTPSDVSFLSKTYDKETVVLQTCWPVGTTNRRLLVFAERVPSTTE